MPPALQTIPSPPAEEPLLLWLVKALAPMKRTRVKQLLQHGRVMVNGAIVTRHDHPVAASDTLAMLPEGALPPTEFLAQAAGKTAKPPFPIVFSDDHLLVVEKPSGLLYGGQWAPQDQHHVRQAPRMAGHAESRAAPCGSPAGP